MKPRFLMVFVALALCAATEALAVGPDPGVRIEVSSRRDKVRPTRGTVTITAIVKNVGNAPYISRPGQQNVQLLETASGATTPLNSNRATERWSSTIRTSFWTATRRTTTRATKTTRLS